MKISKLTQTHIPPFMASDSSVSSPMIFFMVPSIHYTYTYLYCLYFPPYPPILKTESFHWFSQKTHSHKTYGGFGSFPRDLKGNGSGVGGWALYTTLLWSSYQLHPSFLPLLHFQSQTQSLLYSYRKCGLSGWSVPPFTQS